VLFLGGRALDLFRLGGGVDLDRRLWLAERFDDADQVARQSARPITSPTLNSSAAFAWQRKSLASSAGGRIAIEVVFARRELRGAQENDGAGTEARDAGKYAIAIHW
jgi:hypothetical protein